MWSVSYKEENDIKLKSGFQSDKEAEEWISSQKSRRSFTPLKLLVWSELSQCYRTVEEYMRR